MKKRIAAIALATAALLATSAAATAKPAGKKLGGVLKVVAWEGYTENQWVKPFEKQTGCTVQHQYAGSSDEMYNLMKKNAGYDLVSASGDASNRLIASGLVQPIDPKSIPNWGQLTPQLVKGPNHYVGGKYYGLPWQWGPNVLMWNTAKYRGVTNSWSALYDVKNKGKITIPNNPIQIADAALYLMRTKSSLGIKDPYELTKPQLDAAVTLLKQQKKLLKRYWSSATDEIADFKNGDVVIGAGWPYQTLQLKAAKAPINETIPKESTTGWADTWMLAKRAPHPNCAYLWMKYVTQPSVEAKQALVFGETPVNPNACPFMNKIQKGSCAAYHLNEPASYAKSIFFWKTPIAQCGWQKTSDCMDYNAWQQAWTQITG